MKPKIVVIYHSGFGHTEKQAQAVHKGAGDLSEALLMNVNDINWEKLDEADAIILGAPTYMGNVSYQFKKFMDETSSRWFKQAWQDKIAGGFTNSGYPSGDKFNALMQMAVFAAQHQMIWVGVNPMPKDEINRLGSSLGAMAHSTNASPEVTPPQSDLKTAELYGKRVAEITIKFRSR